MPLTLYPPRAMRVPVNLLGVAAETSWRPVIKWLQCRLDNQALARPGGKDGCAEERVKEVQFNGLALRGWGFAESPAPAWSRSRSLLEGANKAFKPDNRKMGVLLLESAWDNVPQGLSPPKKKSWWRRCGMVQRRGGACQKRTGNQVDIGSKRPKWYVYI